MAQSWKVFLFQGEIYQMGLNGFFWIIFWQICLKLFIVGVTWSEAVWSLMSIGSFGKSREHHIPNQKSPGQSSKIPSWSDWPIYTSQIINIVSLVTSVLTINFYWGKLLFHIREDLIIRSLERSPQTEPFLFRRWKVKAGFSTQKLLLLRWAFYYLKTRCWVLYFRLTWWTASGTWTASTWRKRLLLGNLFQTSRN